MVAKSRYELENEAARKLEQLDADKMSKKERLAIPPQPMPEQPPEERVQNTREVPLGYTESQAKLEALRCLQCPKKACVAGCPVGIDIPAFLEHVGRGHFDEAAAVIKESSLLPAICGRVCPQESQCQVECTVGKVLKDPEKSVAIGRLERFVADWEREHSKQNQKSVAVKPDTGHKVAIVGSGPASLVVAADLKREGHSVSIFEAFHKFGGVMLYGIPEFRLPKKIVEEEINTLEKMGVKMVPNFLIGRTRKLKDLLEKDGFEAVFIGTGAGLPRFMNIEGEHLVGVFSANEFLTRANLMKAYQREKAATPMIAARNVAVLGGGNVAMDAARTALRLGAESVHLLYRRSREEMPARVEEVHHAEEEGVVFDNLTNAKRFIGGEDGRLCAIECLKYELGEPDDSGRRRPVPIKNSNYEMAFDTAIVAIGNDSNPLIRQTTPELEVNDRGNIVVDEHNRTSMPSVFAGGDIVLGAATVILAMGEGRRAAAAINDMLSSP